MQNAIARLRTKPGVSINDAEQAWQISIPSVADLMFEIIIPRTALEWFVTLRKVSTKQELWTDWADYYEVNG